MKTITKGVMKTITNVDNESDNKEGIENDNKGEMKTIAKEVMITKGK